MNLPNKLTLGRAVLTAVFVLVLSVRAFPFQYNLALLLFLIAAATDWLDGYLARKHNLVTDFGKLLDPLVDKILTISAFILLVDLEMIAAWVVVVIVCREFLVTGLRLLALAKAKVLPAENLGKYKTVAQMVTIVFLLIQMAWAEVAGRKAGELSELWQAPALLLIALTVILTAWSGASYLWRNRELLADK
jgi:CDP-diacylglycerol--glycerol-3-phosphate 3-phosphatidyltransferase